MLKTLLRGSLSALKWTLSAVGAVAILIVALVATPLARPPELASISAARGTVDFSALPAIERFQARDGTWLGFRHYPSSGPATGRAAIVIHGSSGSSGGTIHALSGGLATRGVETWAVDIRGHGTSGTRGDIGYVGQLEDDLADFVALVRKTAPTAPLTLVGHSSGGGFALRVAGSPIQNLFERTVLLAPYLGYDAPSTRPSSGGWAKADIPRIVGLELCAPSASPAARRCRCWPSRCRRIREKTLVGTYTDRLMRNFAVSRDYRRDLATATRPITIISGADDELMFADKYKRSRARRRGSGRRQADRRRQSHGHRQRAQGHFHHRGRRRAGGERIVMSIESREAAAALSDIEDIVRRVRQSRIYQLASLMLIMWGALVFAGNLGSFLLAALCRLFLDRSECGGIAGSFAISAFGYRQDRRSHLRCQDADRAPAVLRLRLSCTSGSATSRRASWVCSGRSISCCCISSPGSGSERRLSRSVLASARSRWSAISSSATGSSRGWRSSTAAA